jgi:hypothetical protein
MNRRGEQEKGAVGIALHTALALDEQVGYSIIITIRIASASCGSRQRRRSMISIEKDTQCGSRTI